MAMVLSSESRRAALQIASEFTFLLSSFSFLPSPYCARACRRRRAIVAKNSRFKSQAITTKKTAASYHLSELIIRSKRSVNQILSPSLTMGEPVVVQGTAISQPYNPYEHKA